MGEIRPQERNVTVEDAVGEEERGFLWSLGELSVSLPGQASISVR